MPDTPNTANYSWPPMEKRRVMGKPTKRLDGPMKSSGRAKYASDFNQKDLLFGATAKSQKADSSSLRSSE